MVFGEAEVYNSGWRGADGKVCEVNKTRIRNMLLPAFCICLAAGGGQTAAAEPAAAAEIQEGKEYREEREYPQEIISVDGQTGWLRTREIVTELPEETRTEEGELLYSGVTKEDRIPERALFTVEIETADGVLEEEALLSLLRTEYRNPRYGKLPDIPYVFHDYGAEAYEFGGKLFPAEELLPEEDTPGEMTGKSFRNPVFREMLLQAGGVPGVSRLTGTAWDGPPYEGADGVLCRRAVGSPETELFDCVAVYGGEIQLPARTALKTVREFIPLPEGEARLSAAPGRDPETAAGIPNNGNTLGARIRKAAEAIISRIKVLMEKKTLEVSLFLLAALIGGAALIRRIRRGRTGR